MGYIMVVGDIINGVGLDNTVLIHQPAAGVEEIVTAVSEGGLNFFVRLTNGIDITAIGKPTLDYGNLKIGITNTIFINLQATGVGLFNGFTAIQVN